MKLSKHILETYASSTELHSCRPPNALTTLVQGFPSLEFEIDMLETLLRFKLSVSELCRRPGEDRPKPPSRKGLVPSVHHLPLPVVWDLPNSSTKNGSEIYISKRLGLPRCLSSAASFGNNTLQFQLKLLSWGDYLKHVRLCQTQPIQLYNKPRHQSQQGTNGGLDKQLSRLSAIYNTRRWLSVCGWARQGPEDVV